MIPEQARPKTFAHHQLAVAVQDVLDAYGWGVEGQLNTGFELHWLGEYLDEAGTIQRTHYAWREHQGCSCDQSPFRDR